MSLYSQYETDASLEQDGVWYDTGIANKSDEPIRFRIARMGSTNKQYVKLIREVFKKHGRAASRNSVSDEQADAIDREVFCKAVLRGWDGVEDRDGNPVEYNTANAIQLMTDLKQLYSELTNFAVGFENFRASEMEDDAKN